MSDYKISYVEKGHNGETFKFAIGGLKTQFLQQYWDLDEFDLLFKKNDINVLKNVFLNYDMDYDSYAYEYDYSSENLLKGYFSRKEDELEVRKDADDVLSSITYIYARLLRELDSSYKNQVIKDFTGIFAGITAINLFLTRDDSKILNANKYLSQFTNDKETKEKIVKDSLPIAIKIYGNKWSLSTDFKDLLRKYKDNIENIDKLDKVGKYKELNNESLKHKETKNLVNKNVSAKIIEKDNKDKE
jgi:hypothetical protein